MLILPVPRVFGNLQQKWNKTMLKTGDLQAKGRTSTLKTGELCYNIINVNVLVLVNIMWKISRLSWYFIRAYSVSSYCWKYAQQCKLTQDMSTMLSQQHKLRDRIEGCHDGDRGSQPKSLASHYHPFHSTFASIFWRWIWIRPWRRPCHCRSSCSYHQRLFLLAQ